MAGLTDRVALPCVRCGFCCKQGTCAAGTSGEGGRCVHLLEVARVGAAAPVYGCAIAAELMEREKSSPLPMFGSGCSSDAFNDDRDAVLTGLGVPVLPLNDLEGLAEEEVTARLDAFLEETARFWSEFGVSG